MENTPVLTISGRKIPVDIEERYNRWYDAAYGPIFMKTPGMLGIDRYKIIRPDYILPNELDLYHTQNLEAQKKRSLNQDRVAVVRDSSITFHKIQRFWYNTYELMRCFNNNTGSTGNTVNTTVVDAPVLHIEGYRVPAAEDARYEGWFNKWATLIYIPLLLKIPGVRACHFFKLVDYQDPIFATVRFVESDMPRFISLIYLNGLDSLDNFVQTPEFGAFRGSIELGFAESIKIIWDTEYRLLKAYRP
jgi:hypothetical protein